MKIEDLHTLKIDVPELLDYSKTGDVRLVGSNHIDDVFAMIQYENTDFNFYPELPCRSEALRAAALFRSSFRLLKELKHLVRLLEPLEKEGALNVPGLATLNGARLAISQAENTNEAL